MLTETSVKIDLVNGKPLRSLPEVTNDPEDENDRNGKTSHEEVLGVTVSLLERRADSDVELAAENGEAEAESDPGSDDTTGGAEGNLLESAALTLPGRAETNVSLSMLVFVKTMSGRCELTAQMEPQVKRAARAETARSQSKIRPPQARLKRTEMRGRPERSM
jgi:hypothetical protein